MAYLSPAVVKRMHQQARSGTEVVTDKETIDVLSRVVDNPVFFNDPTSDAQGYGIKYESPDGLITIVTYRGTSSLLDAFADAKIRLLPLKTKKFGPESGCSVHVGFLSQFKALEQQTDDFLRDIYPSITKSSNEVQDTDSQVQKQIDAANVERALPHPTELFHVLSNTSTSDETSYNGFLGGPPLVFCGHSLGAANSSIAALAYTLRFTSDGVSWCGFGCPRTGNQSWANIFNSRIANGIRCKHGRDPISALPPKILYRDAGNSFIHIGNCDPFEDISFLNDIGDHDIAKYIACLQNNHTKQNPLEVFSYLIALITNSSIKTFNFMRSFFVRL